MLRRTLLLLAILVLGSLSILGLRSALAGPETRIRWRLAAAVEGFNAARLRPVMRAIDTEWRDPQQAWDRARLADALRATFLQERDSQTRAFALRCNLPLGQWEIAVDEAADGRAFARGSLSLERRVAQSWEPSWTLRLETEWKRDADAGWQIVRSTHETMFSDGRWAPRTKQ